MRILSEIAVVGPPRAPAAFAGKLGLGDIALNAISSGMILTDTIQEELSPPNKNLAKGLQIINASGE